MTGGDLNFKLLGDTSKIRDPKNVLRMNNDFMSKTRIFKSWYIIKVTCWFFSIKEGDAISSNFGWFYSVADPGFPICGWRRQHQRGMPIYYSAKFCWKPHENKQNLAGGSFKICLCRSATGTYHTCNVSMETRCLYLSWKHDRNFWNMIKLQEGEQIS